MRCSSSSFFVEAICLYRAALSACSWIFAFTVLDFDLHELTQVALDHHLAVLLDGKLLISFSHRLWQSLRVM